MLNTSLMPKQSMVIGRQLGRVLFGEFMKTWPIFYGSRPGGNNNPVLPRFGLGSALGALAGVGVKQTLPEAHRFRCHLNELVVCDVGDRLLEGHLDRKSTRLNSSHIH